MSLIKTVMRMVIEIKRADVGEVVLNNLFAQTQMQSVFGINVVALVDGQPKILNLQQLIQAFLFVTAEKWSRAELSICCARPASAPIHWKVLPLHWPISMKLSP